MTVTMAFSSLELNPAAFLCKRSFEGVFKNHNLTARLSPANNAGDAKHESTDKKRLKLQSLCFFGC